MCLFGMAGGQGSEWVLRVSMVNDGGGEAMAGDER